MPELVIRLLDGEPTSDQILKLREIWPTADIAIVTRTPLTHVSLPAELADEVLIRDRKGSWSYHQFLSALEGHPNKLIVMISMFGKAAIRRNGEEVIVAIQESVDRPNFVLQRYGKRELFTHDITNSRMGARTAWGRIYDAVRKRPYDKVSLEVVGRELRLPDEVRIRLAQRS